MAHGFFGFEFHERDALAVFGSEGFDGNEPGHLDGEIVDATWPTHYIP